MSPAVWAADIAAAISLMSGDWSKIIGVWRWCRRGAFELGDARFQPVELFPELERDAFEVRDVAGDGRGLVNLRIGLLFLDGER